MDEREDILDKFEESLGLPPAGVPDNLDEIQVYINGLSLDQIARLPNDLCNSICLKLSQYSFFLQRVLNKEKSRLVWIQNHLNKLIAPELPNYANTYVGAEHKVQLAIKNNLDAQKLQDMMIYGKQRCERITDLSNHIKNISNLYRRYGNDRQS